MKKAMITFFKISCFFVTWLILAGVLDIPNSNPAVWRLGAEFIPLLVLVLMTILFSSFEGKLRKKERDSRWLPATLIGTVVGTIWIGAAALTLLATDQFSIVKNPAVPDFGIWFLAAFLNVVTQEFLIRGYIYRLLKVRHGLTAALAITTLLFTLLHGGAFEAGLIAVINVLTMCLFTHFMFEVEGSLLAPIMAHAVWNIIGGLFLGGIQLADDYPSLFTLIVQQQNLFSGGDYKLEASLFVTILNLVFLVFYYRKYRQQRTNHY